MRLDQLVAERDIFRSKWHKVRSVRLELKKNLIDKESTVAEIRSNSEYKRLKKEQRYISKMIKHIEYKISRTVKNGAK